MVLPPVGPAQRLCAGPDRGFVCRPGYFRPTARMGFPAPIISRSRHRQQRPALGKKYPAKAANGNRIFPVLMPRKHNYPIEIK